ARPLAVEPEVVGLERDRLAAQVLAVRGHAPNARLSRVDERLGSAGERRDTTAEEVHPSVVSEEGRGAGESCQRTNLIAIARAQPSDDPAGRLHEQLVLTKPVTC